MKQTFKNLRPKLKEIIQPPPIVKKNPNKIKQNEIKSEVLEIEKTQRSEKLSLTSNDLDPITFFKEKHFSVKVVYSKIEFKNMKSKEKIKGSFSEILKMGESMKDFFYIIGTNGKLLKINILFEVEETYNYIEYLEDYIEKYSKIQTQNSSLNFEKVEGDGKINNIDDLESPLPHNLTKVNAIEVVFTCYNNRILILDTKSKSIKLIGSHDSLKQIKVLSESYLATLSDFSCLKIFNYRLNKEIKYYKMYSLTSTRNPFFELNFEYFIYCDKDNLKIFDINQDKIIDVLRNKIPVVYFSKITMNVFIKINKDCSYSLLTCNFLQNKVYSNLIVQEKNYFCYLGDDEFTFDLTEVKTTLNENSIFIIHTTRFILLFNFYFLIVPKLKFLCIFDSFFSPISSP